MAHWGLAPHESPDGTWRLPEKALPLLDAERIVAGMTPGTRSALDVRILPVVDSTSAWLMAQPPGDTALACLAEYQTAGRGRRGRHWVMPFGSGLALSLRWEVSGWADVPPRVTLAVGAALASALRELGVHGLGLKWPNDLLVGDRKLGGILVEQRRRGDRGWLVIGLGLNVRLPASTIPVDPPAVDLAALMGDPPPDRNDLAAVLLEALVDCLASFSGQDRTWLHRRWAEFDVLAGEPVRVELGDRLIHGTARGVDDIGRLRVVSGEQEWRLDAGEVRVRRRMP